MHSLSPLCYPVYNHHVSSRISMMRPAATMLNTHLLYECTRVPVICAFPCLSQTGACQSASTQSNHVDQHTQHLSSPLSPHPPTSIYRGLSECFYPKHFFRPADAEPSLRMKLSLWWWLTRRRCEGSVGQCGWDSVGGVGLECGWHCPGAGKVGCIAVGVRQRTIGHHRWHEVWESVGK